jgi:hypothetical protein
MSVSDLKRQRDELKIKVDALEKDIKKAELLEGPDVIVALDKSRVKIPRTKLIDFVTKQTTNVTIVRDPKDILDTDFDLKKPDAFKCYRCKKSGVRLWRKYGQTQLDTPLYCGYHIPYGCSHFVVIDNTKTRLESCNGGDPWVAAVVYGGGVFKNSTDIDDAEKAEWLKLPIE